MLEAIRPCPFPARARWGRQPLAESGRALLATLPGLGPTLWFPWSGVRAEAVVPSGTEPWAGGEVERFDAVGPVPEQEGPLRWGEEPGAPMDGVAVVRRWVRPPTGFEDLRDHATVDHQRALVEVVDLVDGEDPAGATTKRFPHWGDAADLVAILDTGAHVADEARPVVEASQILGQSIVAAMRTVPGRRVVSAHLVALRAADARQPLAFDLEELSHGRTFASVLVRASQGGRLCASTTVLLGVVAPDVVEHALATEPVAGPEAAVPYDMGVTGRDIRVVDAAYTDDPEAPVGPPVIDAWVRFRAVPEEQAIHAGLLAQFTGHMSIAAALRPHAGVGQREAHRTLSTAINAIGISFHADVAMDRWVRYRHLATVVSGGMAHAECRAYDGDGALLASFTVDAMLRPLDRPSPDVRTAL